MAQAPVSTRPTVRQDFADRFAGSLAMHERARRVIPGGITHDGRHLKPFPPYVARAAGARKWDVDGNELIDFVVGHGSLILGHNDPDVTEAVHAALALGTHFGAGHEGEIRWTEAISALVPSAEKVKITASGTESTLLAMRVARAFTGKPTVVKFAGHFHGWNDYALKGEKPPFEAPTSPGIPEQVMDTVAVLPANDLGLVEARLRRGDVAAVIVEPSGGSWATLPLADGFLAGLRDLATAYGAVLIFDEVITGFRWAPGGAQARLGVLPDLTTMAKIVAGGLPGGAVGGRADVMEVLEFKDDPGWNATRKVRHQGTFNANPLVSAAGIACLAKVADPAVQAYCDALAARLRAGMNAALDRRGLPGFAWGDSSLFHISLGLSAANRTAGDLRDPQGVSPAALKQSDAHPLNAHLHLGLLLEGVEFFHSGGFLSVAHTEADVDQTLGAFDHVLERMEEEALFDAFPVEPEVPATTGQERRGEKLVERRANVGALRRLLRNVPDGATEEFLRRYGAEVDSEATEEEAVSKTPEEIRAILREIQEIGKDLPVSSYEFIEEKRREREREERRAAIASVRGSLKHLPDGGTEEFLRWKREEVKRELARERESDSAPE